MNRRIIPSWFSYFTSKENRGAALFSLATFLLGTIAGWVIATHGGPEEVVGSEFRLGGYDLINPLLECDIARDERYFSELVPFKRKLEALLNESTGRYRRSRVSVYFRDLNNGPWYGINEHEAFAPASLLKVPTMIACLKQAEEQPGFLSKRVPFEDEMDYNGEQTIKPSQAIRRGKTYTVDELLRFSIAYSDNNANVLLFRTVNKKILMRTYRSFGVTPPLKTNVDDYMPVKQYASFFRVLFNASYLSGEMSQRALNYLLQSDYRQGIVAGVPASVRVAHKFGERVSGQRQEVKQLHDCGIVYYPQSPYLLCIMSRGPEFSTLDDIMKDVSGLVFEEIDRQHRSRR